MTRVPDPSCQLEREHAGPTAVVDDRLSGAELGRLQERLHLGPPLEHLLVRLDPLRLDLDPVVPVVGRVAQESYSTRFTADSTTVPSKKRGFMRVWSWSGWVKTKSR